MTSLIAFLKTLLPVDAEGRKRFGLALGALVLLAAAYSAGRLTKPTKVITTVKTVTQIQTQIQYQDREVIKVVTVTVHDKAETIVKDTTTDKKPNGEVVTTTHEHVQENEQDKTSNNTQTNKVADGTTDTNETQTVDKTTVTTNSRAGWLVGALVGVNFSNLKTPQGLLAGPITYGAEVDRRLVGPFWGGVWGVTSGSMGLSLKLELP